MRLQLKDLNINKCFLYKTKKPDTFVSGFVCSSSKTRTLDPLINSHKLTTKQTNNNFINTIENPLFYNTLKMFFLLLIYVYFVLLMYICATIVLQFKF